ncbi:molybdenum cofactor biosysynthesis protein [Knoellia flava TL1]|uniref:Molybdenum cofactor biosysynthesis protein n=2 Tax=Knoellia flava TaxID=913969 RepID=A0A8H9FSZ2_9MICO|nr:MOSC domain-containing protein [Knoellia flava]KGN33556.1 molybdenum cofactor biosysynthesis protein [Knoellia flava TL1]GGB73198.1 molybdenum cofactor biosysynthesis protein [Knoellia flava]
MPSPRVTGLTVHPLKSGAIRPVRTATVERAGFVGDRRWMVVDVDARLVSAREVHRLFSVVADTPETSSDVGAGLRLRAPGRPDLHLDDKGGSEVVPVRLHRHDLTGALVSPEADAWLSEAVGQPGLRLVRCVDPTARALNPAYSRDGDHTAYADGYPVTLASRSSLDRLNDWIAETAVERGEELPEPLPMERFRPNVVIGGDLEPFVEDSWRRVRLGEVTFRVAKPVDRCVMTTIDLDSLETGKEPIRTLARHRRWDGATWFAVQLIPDGTGVVRVGDEVVPD